MGSNLFLGTRTQRLQTSPWGPPSPSAHSPKVFSIPALLPGGVALLPSSHHTSSLDRRVPPLRGGPNELPTPALILQLWLPPSHLQLSPGSQSPQSRAFGVPSLKLPRPPGFVRSSGAGSSCPGQLPQLRCDHGNPAGFPSRASRPPQRGREQPGLGEREGRPAIGKVNRRETADKEPPDKGR